MRRISVHSRFASIALAFAVAVPFAHAAADCMVWHAHVRPAPEPTRVGPPPATGVTTIRHPPPGMGSGGGMPTENPSEDELLRRRVQKAVHERDTEEFLRQVPQEPKTREAFLKKHGPSLLDEALRGGALGVARQMLAWDPGALRSKTVAQRLFLLDSLAYTWTHVDESLMRGWPVSRPPPDADFEALFKLLLTDDVRYEGRRQVALAQVAGLPVTPERLRVAGWLLDHGASIEGKPSALAKAVERRNTVLAFRMLADHRPSQEALDEALAFADWREPVELIERLLVAGAAIRQEPRRFSRYFEPAQRASLALRFHGEREPLRLAIRYGADPNVQMSPVRSALQNAMHDHELMEGLLKLGADPNYRATNDDSSLGMAIRTPAYVARMPGDERPLAQIDPATDPAHRARSVELLLSYGADPNQPARDAPTALMATRAEDGAIIEALFAKGGKVMVPEGTAKYHREFGTPIGPVSWSLQQHNATLAVALLQRGARAEGDDCGALYYALVSGQGMAVRALLDGKPNLRFVEKHGRDWPVLLYAAAGGSVEAVRLLLDRKLSRLGDRAPFDPKGAAGSVASILMGGLGGGTGGGENALMTAVMSDNVEVVKELLSRGVDVRQRTGLGLTALDFARRGPNADEIRRLLREKGL